jgi:ribonuclease HII
MKKHSYILGVDEVGRGPLAGPVTVAAVLLPRRFYFPKNLLPFRDSKKLSEIQRERWRKYFYNRKDVFFEVSSVSPLVIDRINISRAVNLAANRAVKRLVEKNGFYSGDFKIYSDGLIKIRLGLDYKMVVKGDEKINAIKAASIIAKTTRDRKMKKIHKKYNNYCFDCHKGYGTRKHIDMVKKYGPSEIHRLTFLHL